MKNQSKKLNRKALGLIFALALMLCIPLISAFEWDNTKSYDPATNTITFRNSFLFIPTTEIATAKLITPQVNYVMPGKDRKVAEMEIESFVDYESFLKDMELIDLKRDKQITREITYKYKSVSYVDVPTYISVCKENIGGNGSISKDCHQEQDGTHKEERVTWIPLEKLDITKGNITIGIFTEVKSGDKVEWVQTIFGLEATEWAVWEDGYADGTDKLLYLRMNQVGIGANAYDEVSAGNKVFNSAPSWNASSWGTQTYWGNMTISNGATEYLDTGFKQNSSKVWTLEFRTNITTLTFVGTNAQIAGSGYTGAGCDGTHYGFAIETDDTGKFDIETCKSDGTTSQYLTGTGLLEIGKLYHIVFVYNTTASKLYVNGVAIKTDYIPKDWGGLSSHDFTLLNRITNTNKPYANNPVEQIILWDRELTPAEILSANASTGDGSPLPGSMNAVAVFPPMFYNFTIDTPTIECNFTATDQNVTSVMLNVTDAVSGLQAYTNTIDITDGLSYNASWITSALADGNYNYSCIGYGSKGINATNSSNLFRIDTSNPSLKLIYPTGDYHSPPEYFDLNYTASDSILGLGSCWYSLNGAANVTLASCGNKTIQFNKMGNNTINLWTNDTANHINYTSGSFYLYANLSYCRETLGYQTINFTFKDESDNTAINATFSGTMIYYDVNTTIAYNQTLTYVNATENMNYTFCISPNFTRLNIASTIVYASTGYPQRTWINSGNNYTNSSTDHILPLLAAADGQYVSFQVMNFASQVIPNAVVNASLAGVLIESKLTDGAGIATFFLNPLSSYLISAVAAGYNTYATSITPTQTTYTLTLGVNNTVSLPDPTAGISYSFSPTAIYLNNGTFYVFNFTISSDYWIISEFGFYLTNGTAAVGNVNAITNGGSTSINATTAQNTTFIVNAYWVVNSTTANATRTYIIYRDYDTGFSINHFFTDLRTYMASGFFGLTMPSFAGNIIIFMIIFITTGIISWKFSLVSPAAISVIVAIMIGLFDSVLGLVYTGLSFSGLPTFIVGLVAVALIMREVTSY